MGLNTPQLFWLLPPIPVLFLVTEKPVAKVVVDLKRLFKHP
jgi:hypothetical protein